MAKEVKMELRYLALLQDHSQLKCCVRNVSPTDFIDVRGLALYDSALFYLPILSVYFLLSCVFRFLLQLSASCVHSETLSEI